ncbi:MAG: hypothetical protein ACXVLF_12285 [Flavisolibacter sp.]
MKKRLCLFALSLLVLCVNAQQKVLVTDKEHLFTTEETSRIDSLLQGYYKKSGNLIVVCTDTLDVSTKTYKDSLIAVYTGDKLIKPYAIFLLLSRRNSKIQLESNELSRDSLGKKDTIDLTKIDNEKNEKAYVTEGTKKNLEEFMKIVSYGVPALKEKKREEGVTIICKKAMEFLDALPRKRVE